MFAPQDRDQLRQTYIDAWRRREDPAQLSALERLIVEVCTLHPEYQPILADAESAKQAEFLPEMGQSNPFLHMGMHIAIREQLMTDRPPGFVAAYRTLIGKLGDAHEAEHQIMECLGQALWEAQSNGRPPDDSSYLECLKRIA
ncbi:MAG: DUF1841 family protein [Gammaproteobacteria bacterium]